MMSDVFASSFFPKWENVFIVSIKMQIKQR